MAAGEEAFPPPRIRPIAIVVFRRPDGRILVAPGYDHVKGQRFYRPLGGEIDFGERAEDAARREIREEIGAEVADLRLLATFENIFVYRGHPGHELVWCFEGTLPDSRHYGQDEIMAQEGKAAFPVRWVALEAFRSGETPLYPDGLLDLLEREWGAL
ncbi:MAG TPA: NUDIX domain-containing protein [Dehalococcoidia bacterium]|nr:NUDIX domain-containing protein [Dehalococcoidia bacterium]